MVALLTLQSTALQVSCLVKSKPVKHENMQLITCSDAFESRLVQLETSGQFYKHFMLVNYDSRVVPDWKIPHITTLES